MRSVWGHPFFLSLLASIKRNKCSPLPLLRRADISMSRNVPSNLNASILKDSGKNSIDRKFITVKHRLYVSHLYIFHIHTQIAKKACLKGFGNLVVGKDCDETTNSAEPGIEPAFLELGGKRKHHYTGRGCARWDRLFIKSFPTSILLEWFPKRFARKCFRRQSMESEMATLPQPSLLSGNCDKDIVTSKLFTTDELMEDKLPGANLSDDEELIPLSFKGAMDSIEKLRT
ncbi:hypothetical protein AVEN_131562-1 [Araneus ventricosus]|uniref:Uncharacterized protein n=1 Tax=Araneus ventricosus TaxID=182803 RepID=A0A4Y2SCH3_ARAVE|nr:hypothetical protein AVEN_131562-1 [Araneus ventricosus]